MACRVAFCGFNDPATREMGHVVECRRLFFFFQAEDGIRDWSVTGVQTCALPISPDFIKGLKLFYLFKDVWFGLLKSASFGFTIALVGCVVGLGTRGGAEGVGRSTTRTVVYSAILILVLDAFWAVVLL